MFEIRNEADRATVYLYGTIGRDWWSDEEENTAKSFSKTLDELNPKPLDIRIDSTGGDVYEGFAIASAIQRYDGETVSHIDGIAASAASYIAVMADRVVMTDYAQLMIHDAWTMAVGNASEMLDTAARLDALDWTICGILASRSGKEPEEVKAAMDAETWYSADEALEAGLCDEVVVTGQRIAASLDMEIAKRFNRIPEELLAEDEPAGESQTVDTVVIDEGGILVLGGKVYDERKCQ